MKLRYDVSGKKVYANPDGIHNPEPDKTKAVRKVVRLIIEKSGNDGLQTKKDIFTNYTKGVVWYKEARVAEWNSESKTMILKGEVAAYKGDYDKLMKNTKAE